MRFDHRRTISATLLAVCLLVAAPCHHASAQSLFFDWGSSEKKDDSGRELVRIKHEGRKGELLVSFGDRRVYFLVEPGKALSYPIAIPREQSRWSGKTTVSMKRENPAWTPTPEMMRENPRLPPWVPGGHPMNPLGTRALYLGASDYRIHGTDAPWTIGTAASKGCVRMYNKDVQDLYPRVRIGAKVTVTWDSFDPSAITDVKELQSATIFTPHNDEDESDRPQHKIKDEAEPEPAEAAKEPVTATVEKSPASRSAISKNADAASAVKSASSVRTAPAAPTKTAAANIETGSLPKPKAPGSDSAAVAPGPSVDEMTNRATAAAERAAVAAERAAAAAERILAAVNRSNSNPGIQQTGTVMSPEPARP